MKQLLYILISVLLLTISNRNNAQTPILKYSFSGNANDESGNNNNGEIIDAILTNDFNGHENSAYEFNGSSSYINAGESTTLKVDTALTIMACIYPTGNGSPNSGGIIVNKEGEYTFARFADGSLRFAIADENGWDNHINTNTIIPLNEQSHVALTYSQSQGLIKVFVNSNLVFTQTFNANVGDHDTDLNQLRIGGRQFLSQFFEGIIDEVLVYDIALEEDEINCILATSTTNIQSKKTVKVYPNPTNDIIHISNGKYNVKEIQIFNNSGEIAKEFHDFNMKQIDLSELIPGYYILKVFTEDAILTSKVVKM